MLTRRSSALVVVLSALCMLVGVAALPAHADTSEPDCNAIALVCTIQLDRPPTDPAPDPHTGVTQGPAQCLADVGSGYVEVPCVSEHGHWSNASQCYWELRDPAVLGEHPPPPGADPMGAWYLCTPYAPGAMYVVATGHWLTQPPPGLGLTPGQAAARIIQTMTFHGIDIGMAPDVNAEWGHRRGHVGIPIWLWAQNRTAQNWGPYTVTATLGSQTVTVTARVTGVVWVMGDGATVACAGPGTAYDEARGLAASPDCGHSYSLTSRQQPGGYYSVVARSQWDVDWVGGGQSGTIPLTAESTVPLEIQELQSVNVPNR